MNEQHYQNMNSSYTSDRLHTLQTAIAKSLIDLTQNEVVTRDEAQRVIDIASAGVGHSDRKT